ncbi:unnamed protein product [Rhizophagus irregularis]|nr:unnamed protein product [Rhizophagus irregularis]
MQLESSHHTNTRKRKASVAFNDEFDYLYENVTTASDWYFLMYTPERIYCSKDDYHIVLTEKIMKDDAELCRGVKKNLIQHKRALQVNKKSVHGLLAIHNAEKVHASDGKSCTNKNPLNIRFSESALKEGSGGGVKLEAVLSNMTSELELLRQQVVELMSENAEI